MVEFQTARALYALGLLEAQQLPEIAADALESGMDSMSLRILAGSSASADPEELCTLFNSAAAEMGKGEITTVVAARLAAAHIARQIVMGQMDPYLGARTIWWKIRNRCREAEELNVFVGLASQYEDDFAGREAYESEIINAAKELLGRDQSSRSS